jgi:drug/metabolite transporter (DMT)-like permease
MLLTLGYAAFRLPISLGRLLVMSGCLSSFFVFYNLGLLYTNTITAAAIMAGSPVYSALTNRWMTGAQLEQGFGGAALLTMAGAAIAVFDGSQHGGLSIQLQGGEILIVASFVGWTAYSVLAQRWFLVEVPQLQRTLLTTLAAIVWLTLFWGLARLAGIVGSPNFEPSGEALRNLFITAVLSTALGALTWNVGVARLGIQAGVMWQNTVPVFAVLVSMIGFDLQPTREQLVGGTIVMIGVLYMQWHRFREVRN